MWKEQGLLGSKGTNPVVRSQAPDTSHLLSPPFATKASGKCHALYNHLLPLLSLGLDIPDRTGGGLTPTHEACCVCSAKCFPCILLFHPQSPPPRGPVTAATYRGGGGGKLDGSGGHRRRGGSRQQRKETARMRTTGGWGGRNQPNPR